MGIAFAWFVEHDEALPLPGEWFIGVEILRKSVLTIQYPLDTGQRREALFPMNTKAKHSYRKKDHLSSELLSSAVDIDDQRWESTVSCVGTASLLNS